MKFFKLVAISFIFLFLCISCSLNEDVESSEYNEIDSSLSELQGEVKVLTFYDLSESEQELLLIENPEIDRDGYRRIIVSGSDRSISGGICYTAYDYWGYNKCISTHSWSYDYSESISYPGGTCRHGYDIVKLNSTYYNCRNSGCSRVKRASTYYHL